MALSNLVERAGCDFFAPFGHPFYSINGMEMDTNMEANSANPDDSKRAEHPTNIQ